MGAAEVIAFEGESVQENNGPPCVTNSMSALINGSIRWRRSGASRRQPSRR